MAEQPTVRAQQLGEELRKARDEAGFVLREAGHKIGASPTKMSRMESGLRGASVEDVAGLCAIYGITGTRRERLLDLARSATDERWLLPNDYEAQKSTFRWLEGRASVLFNYETDFIPGLLQTGEYIRALMTSMGQPEEEVERRKLDRIERQRILRRQQKPSYVAIVDHSALIRPVGGRDVHRRQLEHLVESTLRRDVQLRVIPYSVAMHPGLEGGFYFWRFRDRRPVAYTESRISALVMEDEEAISDLSAVVDQLSNLALSTVESVHLIADLAAELERGNLMSVRTGKPAPRRDDPNEPPMPAADPQKDEDETVKRHRPKGPGHDLRATAQR